MVNNINHFRAFIITINSFGTELTKDDREKLYPTCGRLAPDGLKALARADDYDQVGKHFAILGGCLAILRRYVAELGYIWQYWGDIWQHLGGYLAIIWGLFGKTFYD